MQTLAMLELQRVIGKDAASALVEKLGGTEWYVGGNWPDDHPIVQIVGRRATKKLCDYMGGVELIIPSCSGIKRKIRNDEIARRFNRGDSTRQIALAMGLSQRMVRYIIKRSVNGEEINRG